MYDINQVIIVGRVVRAPELKQTNSGKFVTTISVANNPTKDDDKVSFYDVQAWDKAAENACKFLDKGSQVVINGRLNQRKWEHEGKMNYKIEIVANQIQYVSKPKDGNSDNNNTGEPF